MLFVLPYIVHTWQTVQKSWSATNSRKKVRLTIVTDTLVWLHPWLYVILHLTSLYCVAGMIDYHLFNGDNIMMCGIEDSWCLPWMQQQQHATPSFKYRQFNKDILSSLLLWVVCLADSVHATLMLFGQREQKICATLHSTGFPEFKYTKYTMNIRSAGHERIIWPSDKK